MQCSRSLEGSLARGKACLVSMVYTLFEISVGTKMRQVWKCMDNLTQILRVSERFKLSTATKTWNDLLESQRPILQVLEPGVGSIQASESFRHSD